MAQALAFSFGGMEPCCVSAEHLFWVHGERGEEHPAGPSNRDSPSPPVRREPRIRRLSDGLTQLALLPRLRGGGGAHSQGHAD